ncbi:hypothetical protein FN846DRAFT_955924 [Sphaerosporella brunnea]|uniref:Pentatricopeptide repeat domain-containing protein n=1 Tax=Sphaerosporella brunnea TaxID=1250544 RepID=A0A5J5ESU0_9PEZI|nr:hypothetical protein FN846DRAFT_955924 [Sphaerosporella brunnea]
MLKCRNCVPIHLKTLLSIHTPPPTRLLSLSAVAAARSSEQGKAPGREPSQSGPRSSIARGAPGSPIHRPEIDSVKVSTPLGGGYILQTRDPLRVLAEVNVLLEEGNFDKAHALVLKLTGKIETIHSWNALIKDMFGRKKVLAALKLYNDMKKRKVKPDPYTYSHLFAGLAAQPVIQPSFLQAADKILDHAKNNSSNQEASLYHVNAYLTLCMKAGDIERAWKLLSELPQSGRNAPDAATFTIFLRALKGLGEEALGDGKRVWSGILSRWRKGDLELDEYLLNAYLELLLHGDTQASLQEVFQVARQTADIPYPDDIPSPGPKDPNFSRSVRPDDFTLGIILRAAEKLKNFKLAEITWNTLTERYGIRPSPIAKHLYLRCASIAHDGASAVKVLANEGPASEWDYVVGLNACVTSGGKQESYNKAEAILNQADKTYKAGIMVVRTFLLVAMTTKDGGIIKRALRRIEKYLRPSNLALWEETVLDLPRDAQEVTRKFIFTLKKAIFWDTVIWGRFEEERYLQKFRETKTAMKAWKTVHVELSAELDEGVEARRRAAAENDAQRVDARRKAAAVARREAAAEKAAQPVSRENDRLYQAMDGLRRHTPAQRRTFINSL